MNIYRREDNQEGGCNFCSRYITPYGGARHPVTIVSGKALVVRFCDQCLAELCGDRRAPRRARRKGTTESRRSRAAS